MTGWILAIIYVATIFTLLPATVLIRNEVRQYVDWNLAVNLGIFVFLILAASLGARIYLKQGRLVCLLILVIFSIFLGTLLSFVKVPIERIHVIQYALLAILLFRNFNLDLSRRKSAWTTVFTGGAIGILDEAAQAFIPNRYFQLGDIAFNFLGIAVGFCYIRLHRYIKN